MSGRDDFRFPKECHILYRADFLRIREEGRRSGDKSLQIWALPNQRSFTRLGLIVGKRHGNAVRRNRLKRLIREAFRLTRGRLPVGFDLACSPRVGMRLRLSDLMETLLRVTRTLAGQFPTEPPKNDTTNTAKDATPPAAEL